MERFKERHRVHHRQNDPRQHRLRDTRSIPGLGSRPGDPCRNNAPQTRPPRNRQGAERKFRGQHRRWWFLTLHERWLCSSTFSPSGRDESEGAGSEKAGILFSAACQENRTLKQIAKNLARKIYRDEIYHCSRELSITFLDLAYDRQQGFRKARRLAGCEKKDFRHLLPLAYLSRRERRCRNEAIFHAGCRSKRWIAHETPVFRTPAR